VSDSSSNTSSTFMATPLPIGGFTNKPKFSRDEMNLAEFPLTVLSTRADPSLKTLEFKDNIKGRNGELLERKWVITGADKFGLPTASDDEVLLGLLKITVDAGMCERKVFFTRYELLKTLKWTTEGRSYSRLQKALDRLSGVRIKASNAFYDNETKVHSTRNFGIIDAYEINSGSDAHAKTSYFAWSETIFKSFQSGFIKKLDLDFYLDLQSAVSKRLYRYLDKHFWYKSRVQIDLFTLAHEKIGISRSYQYASSIRQQLDPAIDELVKHGFLEGATYEGKGRNTVISLFSARQKPRVTESSANEQSKRAIDVIESTEGEDSLKTEVIHALVLRGIKEPQALKLVGAREETTLKRILQIVNYFDYLVACNSRLISRSPVGFLFRAVENPETFVLPGDKKLKQADLINQSDIQIKPKASAQSKVQTSQQVSNDASDYLIERKRAIRMFKEQMEPAQLGKITQEVEQALSKVKNFISPSRFNEAVAQGVDDKVCKLSGFPEFESWSKKNSC
jgi:plasmid replication initiation protein